MSASFISEKVGFCQYRKYGKPLFGRGRFLDQNPLKNAQNLRKDLAPEFKSWAVALMAIGERFTLLAEEICVGITFYTTGELHSQGAVARESGMH